MRICPSVGSTTVCTLPTRGKSKIFSVRKIVPQTPPSQIHHGSVKSVPHGSMIPSPVTIRRNARNTSPTTNEINAALYGEPVRPLSRAFALVCSGRQQPARIPSK